ncbi:hypothetical protein DesLBE_3128 [Desulfitobacterium sp. LBE]|uniref:Uncharacterized protein n=6 Tax=root TaxID=1 RepID=Q251G6_DESHY|nr:MULTISPECIES: hypothetical protein [Desulfitobacterium]ACL18302.1 hypothetical protein Dhaf_0234 [Desulfitobacterium hafniense DCB-2]EHL09080.1 hypothetical protein HMPREF0322_00266 [Desulfitobacterium hafniense DP7]KTE92357.1 hypothetical protein AT727_20220 [Desulfitobacterium hafniense]MEA5024442.1 hypothetical protein [Desulfitobacterium hafniense]TWH58787.1 hypothetical protein DesLBE_3128 [Desulfitobacterium sp. LBE]
MSKKGRFLLMFALFLSLSVGLFLSSAANTNAYPDLSPDGKTCTPCHEEGTHGGEETPAETPGETPGETPAETPGETPAEQPAETPAEKPAETPAEQPAETHEPMSPWIVVGGVIVILAVIYFLAIKKK